MTRCLLMLSSLILILNISGSMMLQCSAMSIGSKYTPSFSKWTVAIINELSSNKQLFAHCKSKDDNLGYHTVEVGQTYQWQFKENALQTTLFWCTLWTPTNLHVTFEVFWREKGERLRSRCNFRACMWYARDDGIYLLNIPESSFELIHKWEY